jgi:hypothetical protein
MVSLSPLDVLSDHGEIEYPWHRDSTLSPPFYQTALEHVKRNRAKTNAVEIENHPVMEIVAYFYPTQPPSKYMGPWRLKSRFVDESTPNGQAWFRAKV